MATLRMNKGLRQEDVAKSIGVARTTYAMYEQGRRDPDTKTLVLIAKLFSVSVDYLVSGTTLGKLVHEARVEKGWDLGKLAKITDTNISYVRILEDSDDTLFRVHPRTLAVLACALSDDPQSFLLRTSQKFRFRALEFIDENGGIRETRDPKYGDTISSEELEFIHRVKEEISPQFFEFFYLVSDRKAWAEALQLAFNHILDETPFLFEK